MKSFIDQIKEEKLLSSLISNYEDIEQDLYLLRKRKLINEGLVFNFNFNFLINSHKNFLNLPLTSLIKEFVDFIYYKTDLRENTKTLIMFDEDFKLTLSYGNKTLIDLSKTFYQSPDLDIILIDLISLSDLFLLKDKNLQLKITLVQTEESRKALENYSSIFDTQKYLGQLHIKHLQNFKDQKQFSAYGKWMFNKRSSFYSEFSLKKELLDNEHLPFSDFGYSKITQLRHFLNFFWKTEHSNEEIQSCAFKSGEEDYFELLWELYKIEHDLIWEESTCSLVKRWQVMASLFFYKVFSIK